MIEPKLTPEQRKLIDEYVEVRARCQAWKPETNPHAARFEVLDELIPTWFSKLDAAEAILAHGNEFSVPFSACERKRKLKPKAIPALLKRLGTKWIQARFKPTFKDLEKTLTAEELAKYVTESRTGPRNPGEPVERQEQAKAA